VRVAGLMRWGAALAAACAAAAAPGAAETGAMPEEAMAMNGVYNVMDYGAKADGATDDTGAIQAAIDAATTTGGAVRLPAGEYLVAGNLELKESVALLGVNAAQASIGQRKGTILLATAGRGDEDAPPFIHMTHATTVRGLTIYYPEQKCDDITPYPWTFQLEGFDCTIEDVTLINSYNGIRTGPKNNVRHSIRGVVGAVLRRGIYVDFCTDIGRVENVQFHCHWWSDPAFEGNWEPVYRYMWENLEAFAFARSDWEYMTNNFVFPARIGWRFVEGELGAANGHMTGCGADSTQTALQVDKIQPMGLLITGGQFVSFMGDEPVQVRIAPTSAGSVRFVNCAFWGPSRHNAVIEGTGFVSFSDCYFSNWNEEATDAPLVAAKSGRIQVQSSTFATGQPSVALGPDVTHAIIRGNNGIAGVRVLNEARRAIIADNEDDPAGWSDEMRAAFRLNVGDPGGERYLKGWAGGEPAPEWPDGGTRRWSQPDATVSFPVLPGAAYEVTLDAFIPEHAAAPGDGIYVGDVCIAPLTERGLHTVSGIVPAQETDMLTLHVRTAGWVPAEHDPASSDTRRLGVGVRSITLRAKDVPGETLYDAVTGQPIDE